jgi:hypothetical protein
MDPDIRELPEKCPVCDADVTEIVDHEAGDVHEILCATGHRLQRQGTDLVLAGDE